MKSKQYRINRGYNRPSAKEPLKIETMKTELLEIPEEIETNPGAVQVFHRYKDHLQAIGFSEIDIPQFAMFCTEMATYWRCQKYLAEHGDVYNTPNGYPNTRPEVTIARNALDRAVRIGGKFGINPLDRQRIEAMPPENDATDEFFK